MRVAGDSALFKTLRANFFADSPEFELPDLTGPLTTEFPGLSKRPNRLVRGKGTKKTAKIERGYTDDHQAMGPDLRSTPTARSRHFRDLGGIEVAQDSGHHRCSIFVGGPWGIGKIPPARSPLRLASDSSLDGGWSA